MDGYVHALQRPVSVDSLIFCLMQHSLLILFSQVMVCIKSWLRHSYIISTHSNMVLTMAQENCFICTCSNESSSHQILLNNLQFHISYCTSLQYLTGIPFSFLHIMLKLANIWHCLIWLKRAITAAWTLSLNHASLWIAIASVIQLWRV